MKRPTVVNRRTHVPTNNDVHIGRPSKWGNPFIVQRAMTHQEATGLYRESIEGRFSDRELASLAGKVLVCWCVPLPCHGDVLADVVEAL